MICFPEICKKFYQENSNVAFIEYLTTKYALWIDTRSCRVDNKLHGSRETENSGIKLQIDKVAEASEDLTWYIIPVQDVYTHLSDGELKAIRYVMLLHLENHYIRVKDHFYK